MIKVSMSCEELAVHGMMRYSRCERIIERKRLLGVLVSGNE